MHLLSRRMFGGRNRAERRSNKLGSSLEFADYRNYSPGDDLRSIDWNIYGRLDKLFLKLFEEEEDLHIYLLVDVSASMRWTALDARTGAALRQTKLDLARRIAAALAYIGLAGLDRVNVQFFATGLEGDLGLARGKGHFHDVLEFLERLPPERGQTDLNRSLRAFGQRRRQRGLVMVLSDFFDPLGYEEALSYLLYQRYEVQLIQLLDPAELSPRLLGDLRLTDAETSQMYEVTVNESLTRAYEQEVRTFLTGLEAFCTKRGIGFRRAMTDTSFDEFILRTLRGGSPLLR